MSQAMVDFRSKHKIDVYPNPAQNEITISAEAELAVITIFNVSDKMF